MNYRKKQLYIYLIEDNTYDDENGENLEPF